MTKGYLLINLFIEMADKPRLRRSLIFKWTKSNLLAIINSGYLNMNSNVSFDLNPILLKEAKRDLKIPDFKTNIDGLLDI